VEDAQPRVVDTQQRVVDAQPRVVDTQPRVADTQQIVEDTQPRVADTQPMVADNQPKVEDNHLNSETPNSLLHISDDHPKMEISYKSYNHNGPQRRRRVRGARSPTNRSPHRIRVPRHNRRHRNPVNISTDHNSDMITTKAMDDMTSPTITKFDDNNTVIPDTPLTQAPKGSLRRSHLGNKLIRFDPKTHRIIPKHFANAMTQVLPTHYAYSVSELKLPKLLQGILMRKTGEELLVRNSVVLPKVYQIWWKVLIHFVSFTTTRSLVIG